MEPTELRQRVKHYIRCDRRVEDPTVFPREWSGAIEIDPSDRLAAFA